MRGKGAMGFRNAPHCGAVLLVCAAAATKAPAQPEGALNLLIAGDKADLRIAGFDVQRTGYGLTHGGNNEADTGAVAVRLPVQNYNSNILQEHHAGIINQSMETPYSTLISL
jgi:hypothetical protein